ncbi:hypothetical protein Bca4012_061236 [Brassica carinata]
MRLRHVCPASHFHYSRNRTDQCDWLIPYFSSVSSEPVQQALGSTSDQSSGTETPPLAPPPVTTSVNPEPPQSVDAPHADESATPTSSKSSPVQTSSPPARDLGPTDSLPGPLIGCSSPFPTSGPSIASSSQASVTNLVGSAPSRSSRWGPPVQAPPPFSSTASSSSTFSSLVTPSQLQFRWGSSVQAPVQASAFPPPFSYPDGPNVGISQSSPFGPTQDFANASRTTPKNPFPGFSVDYLPRCPSFLGPNPQTNTPVPGRSPFWASVGTEQGSRYPRYAPTPDLDGSGGQGKRLMSISASNSHRHKSHEELRWEDYKNGDKGGVAWYPPPDHSPSLFAPPSRPDRPRMRTIDLTHRDMSGFPIDYNFPASFPSRHLGVNNTTNPPSSATSIGYNIPTAVQRPHEPAAVSSPSSGCTACGATSSSSPSVHLGLNGTTNPPSSATSLPGLFFSPYGSCPLLFATPNLAAYGIITTPVVQAYGMILGTNFTSQGTTAAPAVQAYPVMFVTPNLAGQGTTTTPAAQPYPTMLGTQNLAAQGTTTTPAATQPYPMLFGTPTHVAQGTTTTPATQPCPTMFGMTNLGAQGITPAAQAYPVNGLNLLPFSAMSLQSLVAFGNSDVISGMVVFNAFNVFKLCSESVPAYWAGQSALSQPQGPLK